MFDSLKKWLKCYFNGWTKSIDEIKLLLLEISNNNSDVCCEETNTLLAQINDKLVSHGDNTMGCPPADGGVLLPGDKVQVCVDGSPVLKTVPTDQGVTYTYAVTNSAGDGDQTMAITVTGSDGSVQAITLNTPGTSLTFDAATGVLNYLEDGIPTAVDVSALISSPHPSFTGSGATTATYDASTNAWVISSTDVSANVSFVDNGNGTSTYVFQDVDAAGNPMGTPVTWTTTNDTNTSGAVTSVDNGDGTITHTYQNYGIDGTPIGTAATWTTAADTDTDTTYSYAVTNDFDGDGIIQITVTATASDGSADTQIITFAEAPSESGEYFSGQPVIDANGIVTFSTAQDSDESAGSPITLDLSALISSPHPSFTGTGATTATFDAGTNSWSVSSTDVSADLTSVTNADGSITHTFQDVDAAGNPVGSPVTFTTGVDADVTVVDTQSTPTGSPIKVTMTGTNSEGDPEYTVDYDASLTPTTATAGAGPWRQVVEDPATGNEHVVRSGPGYREYSDGRVTMWGNATFVPGSQDIRVGVPLPVSVNKPIEYFGDHISLQDVTWAGAPGEPLPTTGANNGIADREHETDMGWAPSTVAPNDEFIIIAYQQENLPGENIGLISWKLTLEGGLA